MYNFWTNALLEYTSLDDIKSQQINFLKGLVNGFGVYKNITKLKNKSGHKAEDLYLKLLGNLNKNVDEILFIKSRDKDDKEIYIQAKYLFKLREEILKKLVNKGIIKSDFDYEKSIAERAKLRRQRFNKIANEEQDINNDLFKEYFKYQSPSKVYNTLSDTKNTERHNIQVSLIKSSLIDLKKDIENTSKDDVDKIEEMNKIADIVELILYDDQQG